MGDIARLVGYSNATAVRRAVLAAAERQALRLNLEQERQLFQARIEARRVEANRILGRTHPVISAAGKVVMVEREDPRTGEKRLVELDDDGVKLAALAELDRLDKLEADLLGLNAARKYEVTGPEGGPVQVEHRVAALMERAASITLLPKPSDAVVHDAAGTGT